MPDRQELDSEDPDSIKNTSLQEGEEPLALPDPGNSSSSHPLQDWPDDAGDDDDDCTVIEVLDPRPLSFAFGPDMLSADPAGQVINAAPLQQVSGAAPTRRRGRSAATTVPSTAAASGSAQPAASAAPAVPQPAKPSKARKKVTSQKRPSRVGPPQLPTGPLAGEEPEPMEEG